MILENLSKAYDIGVVVGRFQVPYLHQGHLDLLETVQSRHKKVIIFLGMTSTLTTRNNPHVGMIYGDGINPAAIERILFNVVTLGGFATSNIIFGSGGDLMQNVNRDTHKFAIKCSSTMVNGVEIEVFKQPKTDSGKNSKKGELKLINNPYDGTLTTVNLKDEGEDVMQVVFENGELLVDETWETIRARLQSQI